MPSAFAHSTNLVPIFCRLSMPIAGIASASAGIIGESTASSTGADPSASAG
jgi:hypothetical protein